MGGGSACSPGKGLWCFRLVHFLLFVTFAQTSSMGFRQGGSMVEASRAAKQEQQPEHFMGRIILSADTGQPLPELQLKVPTSNISGLEALYLTNSQLESSMQNFTRRCSHISRLYSIGNSTNGFPLLVLEISDKPGTFEPEPAFKYVGSMHGDEPLGRELVLLLAEWLCANYLKDPLATLIVQKVHLHLLPAMNPDGFAKKWRNNAHDVDLNRDFPDQFFPENNNEALRQPETCAIMQWIRTTRFTASASFHEGALVANYPYDGSKDTRTKYENCPDDSTFRYLAGVYSHHHRLMSKSKEFVGGITNGAAWYPLYGGMQDWNYLHGDCLELTLEINENKWPPASEVPEIWKQHRMSMLHLVASTVKTGVHGRVISLVTGQPLAATISVSGINHPITASATFGDYHRLLSPGRAYEVTASMVGYESRTTSIMLPKDRPVTLDFVLVPLSVDEVALGLARLRGSKVFNKTFGVVLTRVPPAPQQKALGRVVGGTQTSTEDAATSKRQLDPLVGTGQVPHLNSLRGTDTEIEMTFENTEFVDAWRDMPGVLVRPWLSQRKQSRSHEHGDLMTEMTMQLRMTSFLALVAVTATLIYVGFRVKGGHRLQAWRQRWSR